MNSIFDTIKKFTKICIYRHVNPDFDALGSQYGLAMMIKQLYPNMQVMIKGEPNLELLSKLNMPGQFDVFEEVEDALAIVLDTANRERIDGDDYINCKFIIKIDHHIVVDSFGHINIEFPKKSSTSQIVTELYMNERFDLLSQTAASCLYFGMIADSNRFMYRNTDSSTFKAAAYLLECGINIEQLYQRMYLRKEIDLRINKHILNSYRHTKSGIAYYILTQQDLEQLNISRERGSDFVNILSNIEEYPIWMAITENVKDHNWRVSIRSREVVINEVANQFNGGGHQLASGAKLESIDQLNNLILALENAIKQHYDN